MQDHPAHVGCYMAVMQQSDGEVCVLCYHHVSMFSVVTIRQPRPLNLPVCQVCSAYLHARGQFTAVVVTRLYDILIRRLQFDMLAARIKREVDEYVPGEETVH